MPVYCYRCRSCGLDFEVLVRGEVEPAACAACNGPVTKRFAPFAFHSAGGSGGSSSCTGCRRDSCAGCRP